MDTVAPTPVTGRAQTSSWNDRPAGRRALDVLVLGFAVALATGLVHALALTIGRVGFDRMVWYPRGFFWMSPLAYGAFLGPGVLVLCVLALLIRKPWFLGFSVFAMGTAGAFGLLLPMTQISRAAALVLAAGIGAQFSRVIVRRTDHWIAWSRRFVLAAVVVLPFAALAQRRAQLAGSRAAAAPPDAAPNVLLIVMDAVRSRNVTLSRNDPANTPGLYRRAAEGVVFDWAFSTAPWTLPSHASMFTGLYPRQQSGDWYKPLQQDVRTLAETMRDRGYATGAFVANLHYTAWDTGIARGFDRFDDYTSDWLQIIRCSSYTQTALFTQLLDAHSFRDVATAFLHPNLSIIPQHSYRVKLADRIASDFLRWQKGLESRPFFAFLNLMDAHLPYHEAEPIRSRYPPATPRGLADYDAAIRFIDAQLDSLLGSLEQRGLLDRTIVVVTADHGDLFDQHGLSGHANSLYVDVLHVPLLIRYPASVPAGVHIGAPVSLRDLAATLIDLSGLHDSLPGTTLRHAWTGRPDLVSPILAEVTRLPNARSESPASLGDMRALFDDSLQYIVNEGTGREELYAYRADSVQQSRNLVESDSAGLGPWRERLVRVLRQVRAGRRISGQR
jgi:arylsulfatase A-like enzyme